MNWIESIVSLMETSAKVIPPGLSFIQSMTGYLAWPVTVIILALLLRDRILELLGRLAGVEGFGFKVWLTQETSVIREDTEDQVREQAAEDLGKPGDQVPGADQEGPDDKRSGPTRKETPSTEPRDEDAEGQPDEGRRPPVATAAFRAAVKEHGRRISQATALATAAPNGMRSSSRAIIIESFRLIELALRDLDSLSLGVPMPERSVHSRLRSLLRREIISPDNANSILGLNKLRSAVVHTDNPVSMEATENYVASVVNILNVLDGAFDRAFAYTP